MTPEPQCPGPALAVARPLWPPFGGQRACSTAGAQPPPSTPPSWAECSDAHHGRRREQRGGRDQHQLPGEKRVPLRGRLGERLDAFDLEAGERAALEALVSFAARKPSELEACRATDGAWFQNVLPEILFEP